MNSAIVLIIDRLGTGYLGPYGNTWIETPNLNRLASESVLFENVIVDATSLERTYDSYLRGSHAAYPESKGQPTLSGLLRSAGIDSWLVTDEPLLAGCPWEAEFSRAHHLPPPDGLQTAGSWAETQLARFFASAIDIFNQEVGATDRPFLVWCHCKGMAGAWDAPFTYRDRFADDDDPQPPRVVAPPSSRMGPQHTPDELFGLTCGYAGQVAVLDQCLGIFLNAISHQVNRHTMLIVSSPRGYPLGEHHGVGDAASELYTELVQVPCLLRLPDVAGASARVQSIIQPYDISATLRHWFALPPVGELRSLVDVAEEVHRPPRLAVTINDGETMLRSNAWLARLLDEPHAAEFDDSQPVTELYLKPDDRWDANDIADRCPDIVRAFREFAAQFADQFAQSGTFPPIPELLINDSG